MLVHIRGMGKGLCGILGIAGRIQYGRSRHLLEVVMLDRVVGTSILALVCHRFMLVWVQRVW